MDGGAGVLLGEAFLLAGIPAKAVFWIPNLDIPRNVKIPAGISIAV